MTKPANNSVFPEHRPSVMAQRVYSHIKDAKNWHWDADRKKPLYWKMRNISSGFTQKREVRAYILNRDCWKCQLCGSVDNLTIDHIKSVYSSVYGNTDPNYLNSEENLRVLCNICNSKQSPLPHGE